MLVTIVVPSLEILDKHYLLQPMQVIFLYLLALKPHLFYHSSHSYYLFDYLHICLLGQPPYKHNTLIQYLVLVIIMPQSLMVTSLYLNTSLIKLIIQETLMDFQQQKKSSISSVIQTLGNMKPGGHSSLYKNLTGMSFRLKSQHYILELMRTRNTWSSIQKYLLISRVVSLCSCVTNLVNTTSTLLQFQTGFSANRRYLSKIKTSSLLKVLTIYSKTDSSQGYV